MAGQHRSSTSTAVERGQQYCGGHGQEGPDWQRLLLPLSNLLVPCSQIDFGMNCCGRAQPEAAGHGAGWGGAAGWAVPPLLGQTLLPCHSHRLPRSVATLMAGAGAHAGLPLTGRTARGGQEHRWCWAAA